MTRSATTETIESMLSRRSSSMSSLFSSRSILGAVSSLIASGSLFFATGLFLYIAIRLIIGLGGIYVKSEEIFPIAVLISALPGGIIQKTKHIYL